MSNQKAPAVTPWFGPDVKPARRGAYRVQDHGMRCHCCWIELYWTGKEWRSTLLTPGYFRTHFFTGHLRRWRGLAQEAKP